MPFSRKLKNPYLKEFSQVDGIKVFIVDGQYIRRNMEKEFTNYGQHYRFSFIPKNELWIDKEAVSGEENFFIEHMLVERSLMLKGASYEKAVDKADEVEKKERAKSELARSVRGKISQNATAKKIYKQELKNFSSSEVKVWIVNGELVRDLYYIDFTEGGHGYVYSFIPRDEVWIDDDVSPKERKFVLLHELHERALMADGMDYDKAHTLSSKIEYHDRYFPSSVKKDIIRELKINQKIEVIK